MTRRLQDEVLERELLLFILDHETNLGTVHVDYGFCGAQEMMGALSSPPVSKTTKSTRTYDCPTQTMASSRTPLGSRVTDLHAANAYLCTTKYLH